MLIGRGLRGDTPVALRCAGSVCRDQRCRRARRNRRAILQLHFRTYSWRCKRQGPVLNLIAAKGIERAALVDWLRCIR